MRLQQEEIDYIKTAFLETFTKGKLYLFGSRLDDRVKGGDIDLFIEVDPKERKKRVEFLKRLYELEWYEFDVVIARDGNRLIEQNGRNGVLLVEKN